MKKAGRAVTALLSLLLAISFIMPGAFLLRAEAVSADYTEKLINEIFDSEISIAGAGSLQSLLDGKYADNAGVSSDWFVLSIIQYKGNSLNYSAYAEKLKAYCSSKNSHDTATAKERLAIMSALLNTNSAFIREVCDNNIGALGLMSYIFGLHILANGYTSSKTTQDEVIGEILGAQLDDGGWDISNKNSDPDVTAMAVQALAHFYGGSSRVKSAVDKALSLLSAMQLASGGYKSYGTENPESSAQVITALTSLGINPFTDNRFIKNGKSAVDAMLSYKVGKGGYSHKQGGEYNLTATSQVLYSLVSIYRQKTGAGSLYNLKTDISVSQVTEKTSSQTRKESLTYSSATRSSGNSGNIRPQVTTTSASNNNQTAAAAGNETTTENGTQAVTFTAVSSTRARRSTEKAEFKSTKAETAKAESSKTRESNKKPVNTTAAPGRITTAVTTAFNRKENNTSAASQTSVTEESTSGYEETSSFYYEEKEDASAQTDNHSVSDDDTGTVKTAQKKENNSKSRLSKPKKIIIAAIWAAALTAALIFIIKKNKKAVNYAIIIGIAAALTAGTVFADIMTPEEYYKKDDITSPDTVTVTMSITCDTVKGRGDESITPSNGVILPETQFTLESGATAYDCLIKAAKEYKIQIEDNTQALGNHSNAYIAGINYLYEFDYGELSGWMFSVNGEFADRGCGEYTLSDSDVIRWEYTCNMGDDLK